MNILYTVNQCLENGEVWDRAILLHLNDDIILRLRSFGELENLISQLNWVKDEIFTNYPEISH
jgi:chorismate-pyruvate lyase